MQRTSAEPGEHVAMSHVRNLDNQGHVGLSIITRLREKRRRVGFRDRLCMGKLLDPTDDGTSLASWCHEHPAQTLQTELDVLRYPRHLHSSSSLDSEGTGTTAGHGLSQSQASQTVSRTAGSPMQV